MSKRLLILIIILIILLIILITMGIFSFLNKNKENQGSKAIREENTYHILTDISEFPREYRGAIEAIIEKLRAKNENPEDYYAKIYSKIGKSATYEGNIIEISVIHKDTHNYKGPRRIGNISGKDRVVYYNLDSKEIIDDLFVQ